MDKTINVTGVISSAREGSFSAALVRAALEGAKAAGAQVTVIDLPKKNIGFCEGCLKCLKAGKCFKSDDFEAVKKQITGADGIIWGSPVYAAAPNAIMKNLIDRFGMLEVSTSQLGGKYMAGIAAANSAGAARKAAKSLSRFGLSGTFARSFSSGYMGESTRGGRQADEAVLQKARALGSKLVSDIKTGRRYALQGLLGRMISSVLMKPAFRKYILENREGDAKALFESLKTRGLLA